MSVYLPTLFGITPCLLPCDVCDLLRRLRSEVGALSVPAQPPISGDGISERFIYVVRFDPLTPVKIGSTSDLIERFQSLRTDNSGALQALWCGACWTTENGILQIERRLHSTFSEYRVRSNGEWFTPSGRLRTFLEHIRSKLPPTSINPWDARNQEPLW